MNYRSFFFFHVLAHFRFKKNSPFDINLGIHSSLAFSPLQNFDFAFFLNDCPSSRPGNAVFLAWRTIRLPFPRPRSSFLAHSPLPPRALALEHRVRRGQENIPQVRDQAQIINFSIRNSSSKFLISSKAYICIQYFFFSKISDSDPAVSISSDLGHWQCLQTQRPAAAAELHAHAH